MEAIGGDDPSHPALLEAMVRGGPKVWAVTSYCEAVVLAKEEAGRLWEHPAADLRLHPIDLQRR